MLELKQCIINKIIKQWQPMLCHDGLCLHQVTAHWTAA